MPRQSTSIHEPRYPCPCCGFIVFDEPAGSYDICPQCGWEDDHVQLAHPTMRGGANGGSLLDYQTNILQSIPPEVQVHRGYQRAPAWRPLAEADYAVKVEPPKTGPAYFFAALQDSPPYYWQT